jgi:hypothetical protein
MSIDLNVGYADFIRLCHITTQKQWGKDYGLAIRCDGIYVRRPPPAFPGEQAILSQHPTGNLKDPVLVFPCLWSDFFAFQEAYGLYGIVDAHRAGLWAAEQARYGHEPVSLDARTERSLLNTVGALIGLLIGKASSGTPNSVFKTQTAIIAAIEDTHSKVYGCTKRNLEATFSKANRSLKDEKEAANWA